MERQYLIHIHSDNLMEGKAASPSASSINYGEIAINYNAADPSLFIKDSEENIIKFNGITKKEIQELSSATKTIIEEDELVISAALNELNATKISEPATEGTNGQVLTTDGNGGRTWTTVQGSGGGSPIWGNITGTLSAQTDLQNVLTEKLDASAQSVKSASVSNQTLTITNHDNSTVSLTNTTYDTVTTSTNGLMSSSDKTKLNGIADNATNVTESTVNGWGFTKNNGTVTSVAVKMNNTTKGTITTSGTINLGTVVTSESDPVFCSSPAYGITSNNITAWNNKQDAISDLSTIRYYAISVPFVITQIAASSTYTLNGTAKHTYQYMILNNASGINTINVQLASDSATNSVAGWQHYLLIYNNTGANLNIVIGRGLAATKSIITIGHAQQIELAWMIHYETNKYNYILTVSDTMTWLS